MAVQELGIFSGVIRDIPLTTDFPDNFRSVSLLPLFKLFFRGESPQFAIMAMNAFHDSRRLLLHTFKLRFYLSNGSLYVDQDPSWMSTELTLSTQDLRDKDIMQDKDTPKFMSLRPQTSFRLLEKLIQETERGKRRRGQNGLLPFVDIHTQTCCLELVIHRLDEAYGVWSNERVHFLFKQCCFTFCRAWVIGHPIFEER
jgi:hypothetical protein